MGYPSRLLSPALKARLGVAACAPGLRRVGPTNARRTKVDGVTFDSAMESRVYLRLRAECAASGARLYRQVRFPLLNLAPGPHGRPLFFTPDFVVVARDGTWRVVDAKARTRSGRTLKGREWTRGKAAFEAWYVVAVEEADR